MIRVKKKTRQNTIEELEISGHAEFAEHGEDIVCAAVSLVGTGLLNALDIMAKDQCELVKEDNRIYIKVLQDNEVVQNVLRTGLIQLETLSETFNKYVRIEKMEE